MALFFREVFDLIISIVNLPKQDTRFQFIAKQNLFVEEFRLKQNGSVFFCSTAKRRASSYFPAKIKIINKNYTQNPRKINLIPLPSIVSNGASLYKCWL